MKTSKTIQLRDNTAINIEKGTILKTRDDMFIVAEIGETEVSYNPCHEINMALYGNKHNLTFNEPYPKPKRYILASLLTGSSRFGEPETLKSLNNKISESRVKFGMVHSIEFKES